MKISFKQLENLSVETVLGVKVGNIQDIVVDTDGQQILQYAVRRSFLRRDLFLIGRDQVVRFEESKMIVDNTVRVKDDEKEENQNNLPNPEPVAMRN